MVSNNGPSQLSLVPVSQMEDLENERTQLTVALSNAIEGIAKIGTDGKFEYTNAAFARAHGYEPIELLGHEWTHLIKTEDLPKAQKAYQEMLVAGRSRAEVRGLKKDGTDFLQESTVVQRRDKGGNILGHYAFIQDLTARQSLEWQIKSYRENKVRIQAIFLGIVAAIIFTAILRLLGK